MLVDSLSVKLKKIIYIVINGLSNVEIGHFHDKTVLESALTFNLDKLSQRGQLGVLVSPSPQKKIPIIDFLIEPSEKNLIASKILESGMDFVDGNLASLISFSSKEEVAENELKILIEELNLKIILLDATFELKLIDNKEAVIIFKGVRCGLFRNSNADYISKLLEEFTKKANKVIENSAVNNQRLLLNKPLVDGMVFSSFLDKRERMNSLKQEYEQVNPVCFFQNHDDDYLMDIFGMQKLNIPEMTGHVDIDYALLAKSFIEPLNNEYNLLLANINCIDEKLNLKDEEKNKSCIENLDKYFFKTLFTNLDFNNFIVCLVSNDNPGVILLSGSGIKPDGSMSFSEKTAHLGSLGQLAAHEILPLLVKLASK